MWKFLALALLLPLTAQAGNATLTIVDKDNQPIASSVITVEDTNLSKILATFRATAGTEITTMSGPVIPGNDGQVVAKAPITSNRTRTDAELWNMVFETGWNYVNHYVTQFEQQKALNTPMTPVSAKAK